MKKMCCSSCSPLFTGPSCAKRRRTNSTKCLKNPGSVVHSGQFMSSHVHDTDDIYTMPPPSPDVSGPATASLTEEVLGKIHGSVQTSIKLDHGQRTTNHLTRTKLIVDYDFISLLDKVYTILSKHVISPKWKNFSGCGLDWLSKIRLNNTIWRAWHQQYVLRYKDSIVCISPSKPNRTEIEPREYNGERGSKLKKANFAWRKSFKDTSTTVSRMTSNEDSITIANTLTTTAGIEHQAMSKLDSDYGLDFNLTNLDLSTYHVDTADTLFSSCWNTPYPDIYSEPFLNSALYQPIMGQMYAEFNTNYINCLNNDYVLVNSNEPKPQEGINGYVNNNNNSLTDFKVTSPPGIYLDPSISNSFESGTTANDSYNNSLIVTATQPVLSRQIGLPSPQSSMSDQCLFNADPKVHDNEGRQIIDPTICSKFVEPDLQTSYLHNENLLNSKHQPKCPSCQCELNPDGNYYLNNHMANSTPLMCSDHFIGDEPCPVDSPGELSSGGRTPSSSLGKANDNGELTAEEKRRKAIKFNFIKLESLLPESKLNTRKSKALILQSASEFIHDLSHENTNHANRVEILKQRVQSLESRVADLRRQLPDRAIPRSVNPPVMIRRSTAQFQSSHQSTLPTNAIDTTTNYPLMLMDVLNGANRSKRLNPLLCGFFRKAIADDRNWSFYMLALMMIPLYKSFVETVSFENQDTLKSTLSKWHRSHFQLSTLRTAAYEAIVNLGNSTSIHADPLAVPEECRMIINELLELELPQRILE